MSVLFEDMPAELVRRPNWLLWRRDGARKVPYQADKPSQKAKSTDPTTWATFDTARVAYRAGRDAGIGFALNGDGLAVIDIDGDTSDRAVALLHDAGCRYIETSPSGNGLHGWGLFEGRLPRKRGVHEGISVEIYSAARYMSVTGQVVRAEPFAALDGLHALSRSLIKPGATQETQETQEAQETQEKQETQVSVGAIPEFALTPFLPPAVGNRNRCLFELARYLKSQAPEPSKAELRTIVKEWHRMALETIRTTDFLESWGDFMRSWEAVRCPKGEVLSQLVEGVDSDPFPEGTPDDYGPRAVRLVKICRRLQIHAGDRPFFIGARVAGELLDLHHTNAANLLRALSADGVIELVNRGTRQSGASEYRMLFKPAK